jgi:hypothetical protein
MRKIVDYKVIVEDDFTSLKFSVNQSIGLGWQPLGSSTHIKRHAGILHCQTMVKYEAEKSEYEITGKCCECDKAIPGHNVLYRVNIETKEYTCESCIKRGAEDE